VPLRAFTVTPITEPTPVSTINEFIPEDRDLTECISAVPKPGCGSEARTSWEQGALLVVLVVALAFIAWRVIRAARRKSAAAPASGGAGPDSRSSHDA
jgi:hypothetical protein